MNKCRRRIAKSRRRKAKWIVMRVCRLKHPYELRRRRLAVSEMGWIRGDMYVKTAQYDETVTPIRDSATAVCAVPDAKPDPSREGS